MVGPRRVEAVRVRVPTPGPGEILVRLEGSGVCASNLLAYQGREWFQYPMPPGAPGLPHHAVKAGAPQVGALGEQGVQGAGLVEQTGLQAVDAEAHVRGLPGHAQGLHQFQKIGIGFAVEDDEAGVHRIGAARQGHVHGMGVAADIIVGLIDDHLVLVAEQIGARQSRDAGADYRDAHGISLSWGCCFASNRSIKYFA
jgi:hypothetical protein